MLACAAGTRMLSDGGHHLMKVPAVTASWAVVGTVYGLMHVVLAVRAKFVKGVLSVLCLDKHI